MAFWWVNQTRSFKEEFEGEYLWAPQRTADNRRQKHWTAMTAVEVDDVIVHYVGKPRFELVSVSAALTTAWEQEQPDELKKADMWRGAGWKLRVKHVDEVQAIGRDEAIALGRNEQPFTVKATVKEGYLWPLSRVMASALLDRMDPSGQAPAELEDPAAPGTGPETVALEAGRALKFEQIITAARREAVRSEWQLIDAFVRDLGKPGLRRRYPLTGGRNLYADAWFPEARVLVEAKAAADRRSVREAIGQLFDYAQKEDGPVKKVVVLPHAPANDLLDVLRSAGITAIWRTSAGWSDAFGDASLWSAT